MPVLACASVEAVELQAPSANEATTEMRPAIRTCRCDCRSLRICASLIRALAQAVVPTWTETRSAPGETEIQMKPRRYNAGGGISKRACGRFRRLCAAGRTLPRHRC